MRISCIAFVILLMSVLSFRAEGGRGHKKKHGNAGSKKCTTPGKCSSLKHDIPLPDSPTNVSCPKCDKIFCKPKNPNRLKCKGGFARGVCGCCPVCAKLEGESCGGRNTYLGTCDVGLTCEAEPISSHHMLRTIIEGTQTSLSATASGLNEWKGICKKIDRIQTEPPFRNQQPHRDECRPECTPEFCMANPKDICSATNSAILSQDCQEKCQHTACNACFFQEEPACQKCGKNVFSCIQKFARCTKKKICSKKKYPCKKSKRIQSGKFLCWVPKCL